MSSGPATARIPDVVGDGENSALGALEDAGFSVSREYEYSSRVDAGVVISQSLTGSAMPGTTITITISRGPEPDTSTPDTPATSPDSPTTGEDEEESAGAE